ncbi:MAG TPA: CHASE sensor domain-containing protein, partial [Burkholderiales bacterium]|nr:CHASE sensor domain-containing protein [Burkholderiales bacterium]
MIMSVTIPALLAAIVAMVAYDLALYHRSWIADLKTQAQLLAQTSAPALIFNDDRSARENLALLRYRPQVHAAAIYDARGKLLASFSREGAGPLPELPEADGARVMGNELVVFKRIVNNREILGTVYIRAEYALFARLLTYVEIALLVIAGAGLMAYVLSRYVQRTVSAPLAAIAGVAREVTEKRNFSLRAARLSDDEV